jgi:hypothetical protein
MIYLTDNNLGVGLHVVDFHGIWCEDEFISDAEIHHLVHEEKVDRKFGNMQHILEASVGEFNPSFVSDFNKRVIPHYNGRTFAYIERRIYFL